MLVFVNGLDEMAMGETWGWIAGMFIGVTEVGWKL